MLQRSFSMLPGIGDTRERVLWKEGIGDWDLFLEDRKLPGISMKRKRYFDALLKQARNNLDQPAFLSSFFPGTMHWRLYPHLLERTAFIDIETTGLSQYSHITVIGIYRTYDRKWTSLVKGMGLSNRGIREALENVDLLVSYNGTCFDLPFIQRQFPGSLPDVPHFDLRFAARRLGYRGGLKSLEYQLGIEREYEVQHLAGEDAQIYWKMWNKDKNRRALQLLRKYNKEDVQNLEPIANILYPMMERQTLEGIDAEK